MRKSYICGEGERSLTGCIKLPRSPPPFSPPQAGLCSRSAVSFSWVSSSASARWAPPAASLLTMCCYCPTWKSKTSPDLTFSTSHYLISWLLFAEEQPGIKHLYLQTCGSSFTCSKSLFRRHLNALTPTSLFKFTASPTLLLSFP